MLFRLNTIRAVVVDVPMDAVYGDEVSNLRISRTVLEFLGKHIRNFHKRIFYNYFLRDVSITSRSFQPDSRCSLSRSPMAAITGYARRAQEYPRQPARS